MGSAPHYARSGRDQTVRRGLWGHRESRGPRWNRGARPSSHCWRIRLRNVYGLDQSHTADVCLQNCAFSAVLGRIHFTQGSFSVSRTEGGRSHSRRRTGRRSVCSAEAGRFTWFQVQSGAPSVTRTSRLASPSRDSAGSVPRPHRHHVLFLSAHHQPKGRIPPFLCFVS